MLLLKKTLFRLFTVLAFAVLLSYTVFGQTTASAISKSAYRSIMNSTSGYDPTATLQSCGDTSSTLSTASSAPIPSGSSLYILGDSITVRAESKYMDIFKAKGITPYINAQVSRSWNQAGDSGNGAFSAHGTDQKGSDALTSDKAAVAAAKGVVIALGSNGGSGGNPISTIIAAVKAINPDAPIWWINLTGTDKWSGAKLSAYMGDFNKSLSTASKTGSFNVIDWASAVAPDGNPFTTPGTAAADPKNMLADGLHPNGTGTSTLATILYKAVTGSASSTSTSTPGSACCQATSTLQGSDNQQKAFNFFVGKGLTPQQAAGIIGNLMGESGTGISPKAQQDGSKDPFPKNGVGFGIAQWTFSSRQDRLVAFADKAGLPVTDFGVQLEFVWHELDKGFGSLLERLKASTDVHTAVLLILQEYEGPADHETGGPNDKKRTNYANGVLALYGASSVSSTGATTVNGGCTPTSLGVGEGKLTPSQLAAYPGVEKMLARAKQFAAEGRNGSLFKEICGSSCHSLCDHIAASVWDKNGGHSGYCSAIVHWQSIFHYDRKNAHTANDPDGMSPPVGALLYYYSTTYGHVTIYLGNNLVLSNDVLGDGGIYITSFKNITDGKWHMPYLGWTPPIFGDTGPPSYENPIPCK